MRHSLTIGIFLAAFALATSPMAVAQTNSSASAILLAPVAPTKQVTNMTLQVPQGKMFRTVQP